MEKLILNSFQNSSTDRLLSMMYLDKGKYEFQRTTDGILIDFTNGTDSFRAFIRRFSLWITREAFLYHGDHYFRDHPQHELWKLWKHDIRFLHAYCDEFYQRWLEYQIGEFLGSFEEYEMIEVRLEDLFADLAGIVRVRLDLVSEHFSTNQHPEYIKQQIALWKPKLMSANGMKPDTQS